MSQADENRPIDAAVPAEEDSRDAEAHAADESGWGVPSQEGEPTARDAAAGRSPTIPPGERHVIYGEVNPPPHATAPSGVQERMLPVEGLAGPQTQEEEPAGSGQREPELDPATVQTHRGELAEAVEAPVTTTDEELSRGPVGLPPDAPHRETADQGDDAARESQTAANTAEQAPLEPPPGEPKPKRKRSAQPIELIEEADPSIPLEKNWYILKVATNRENSACDALRRRVKIAGMDEYFDEVLVPTEDIVEYKDGKRKTIKRKLYPGYIVVHMAITDDTWFLVRETPGVGDFTGAAGKPSPMLPHEVERILPRRTERPAAQEKVAISFKRGDRVRVKEGNFQNYEGEVEAIDEANGRVTVVINIFNRSTPVEFDYWQIEAI